MRLAGKLPGSEASASSVELRGIREVGVGIAVVEWEEVQEGGNECTTCPFASVSRLRSLRRAESWEGFSELTHTELTPLSTAARSPRIDRRKPPAGCPSFASSTTAWTRPGVSQSKRHFPLAHLPPLCTIRLSDQRLSLIRTGPGGTSLVLNGTGSH